MLVKAKILKALPIEDHSISPFEAYRKLIKSAKNEIIIENFSY